MGKYDFELDLYDNNTLCWIADTIKPESKVLEFGPANGRLTKFLTEKKQCIVDIVEIDEDAGEEASEYARKAYIGPEKGDIEKYYWLNGEDKFDYLIFADVLEHLVHAEQVLKRCKKKLVDGGMILVSIPNVSHNSVIISLFKDEFKYNPTGILDNTHVRFFTKKSFEEMALRAGWAVIGEAVKRIRVGETEINNSYADVPKEFAKELIHREQGDIYQYMFTLCFSEDYLRGKYERTVSLDSTSQYYMEILFDNHGTLDYRKSISKYFDPYNKELSVEFNVMDNSTSALFRPINCNCILDNIELHIRDIKGETRSCEYKSNGRSIGSQLYFCDVIPEIKFQLDENDVAVLLKAKIINYDFDSYIVNNLLDILAFEQRHILEIKEGYEQEIERKGKEIDEIKLNFEEEISEMKRIYEGEIERRERERLELLKLIEKK